MNKNQYRDVLTKTVLQRNGLFMILLASLVTNILLGIAILRQDTRVVVVPPQIKREFWVEQGRVSPQYVEQMSLYFAHLLLDMTPKSLDYQKDHLLPYIAPEFYGVMVKKLEKDAVYLREQQITLNFQPIEAKVDIQNLSVQVIGDMAHYVGTVRTKQERVSYTMTFDYRGEKLLITSFDEDREGEEK